VDEAGGDVAERETRLLEERLDVPQRLFRLRLDALGQLLGRRVGAAWPADRPPGSSPVLHCAPSRLFGLATTSEPPAEPLPEPGVYIYEREGQMIPLVRHDADNGAPVHFLHSHEAAADILRAFGGDPSFLDTISADPKPNTP
jgi:hypothetical protein